MFTFSQSLDLLNIKHSMEETPAGLTLRIFEGASADAVQCVTDLATSVYGFAVDQLGEEVASSNIIHLVTKDSPRYLELAADANFSSEEDDEVFAEEEPDEVDGEAGEEGEESDEDEEEDDEEDLGARDLKVLIGPEHHKMATKLYVGLCNNQNLARFPAFTIDLDQFLQRYYVRPPVGSDFDTADFGEEASAVEVVESVPFNAELASKLGDFLNEEIAKKGNKSGRAGFLSVLMKLISGDEGESIVNAFDAGDDEKLRGLMTEIVGKIKAVKAQ